MKKEFYQSLFLPTSVVLLYWLLNLPTFFTNKSFFESHTYELFGIILIAVLLVLIIIKFLIFIYRKQYKSAIAIVLGVPVAAIIGYISFLALFATSGI